MRPVSLQTNLGIHVVWSGLHSTFSQYSSRLAWAYMLSGQGYKPHEASIAPD
ncbi:hypothetical protein DPMN_105428 [Dreissena polymorpha]|uniref:Uncharacterized protein n=1 Tax=Dreissena polymorpha TaxID=45954 RepID=A0A9D4HEQ0_DREPO|nr:hypothetical protein DPMN_105428 [Dreissena polymorpha]